MRPHSEPPPLLIRLLGTFELKVDGVACDRVPLAVQSLIGLLILRPGSNRQVLASDLWPDATPEQAAFYLRRALTQLRRHLGTQAHRIDRELRFDLTGCDCDLAEFLHYVKSAPDKAVSLYRGPLVSGKRNHRLGEGARQVRESYLGALSSVVDRFETNGEVSAAIRSVRLLLAEDQSNELAWRKLIHLLGVQHDHVGAARAYRQLRIALREELGMEPDAETAAVYRRVMAESDVLRMRPETVEKPKRSSPKLPTPLTALIGRQDDLVAIREALSQFRLVILVGMGGVGKTRLAVEIAETWDPSASISLARAQDSADLRATLSTGPLFDDQAKGKKLLVLDNAEQILDSLEIEVRSLLEEDKDLVVLVTSRRNVSWQGGQVYRLGPLELPNEASASLAELAETPSVKLFVGRARAASGSFQFSSRNAESVVGICSKLDGLPLALELAAAKIRSLSISEIDRRLSDRFEWLSPSGGSRTLEAILDWSFQGLEESTQDLFLDVASLPGSWSIEACGVACKSFSLESLDTLVALDLVTFAEGRYRCILMVREFGLRKRTPAPEFLRRLAEFYFREVEDRFPALQNLGDGEALAWFSDEERNLIWVLQSAAESEDCDFVRQALVLYTHLEEYWFRSRRAALGYRLGQKLIERRDEPSAELTAALFAMGGLAHLQGWFDAAEALSTRADSMAKELELHAWRAESLRRRAELLSDKGKLSQAHEMFAEALLEYEELGDRTKQAICLRNMGYVEREQGCFSEALDHTKRALRLHTETNDAAGRSWCIGSLGAICLEAGDPEQAVRYFEENIEMARAQGDIYTGIWNRIMLGQAELEIGRSASAAEHVREAIAMHGPEPDVLALEWPTSLLGEILTELGEYEAADETFGRAWQIHLQAGDSKLGAFTMLRRAELHRRWERPASARSYFEIAEEIVQSSEVKDLRSRCEVIRQRLSLL